MATPLTVLSFSKIKLFRTCRLAFRRHYIDHATEPVVIPGETGTGFHEWAHRLSEAMRPGAGVDEELAYELLCRKAALLDEPAAADLRQLVSAYMERGGLPGFPSDAQDVAYELRIAVDQDGNLCEWDDPAALFRGILDQTYRENGGELAVVRDWKTSRVIEEPADQMRLYGYLDARKHLDVEEIVVELHFVRFRNGVRSAVLDAEDLRAVVPAELLAVAEELRRSERDDDWRPRVSDACRICGYIESCPKFRERIQPFRRIGSDDEAREGADQLVLLKAQAAALEKALKAWCRMNGAVDLGDELLGFIQRDTEKVVDTRLAARLLRQRIGDDAIWAALSLGKGPLSKLLSAAIASAPRTGRKEAREALMQELRDAGAIEERVSTTFKRAKRQAEELDEETEGEDGDA